jgi:hypothetical protein
MPGQSFLAVCDESPAETAANRDLSGRKISEGLNNLYGGITPNKFGLQTSHRRLLECRLRSLLWRRWRLQ